ncbi:hypothetical protein OPV22_018341 [Ensete ventricosum]|uniref:AB hydrolase-1 domain-containing protein n=1 Tax=Ensete ventricosum TaxID=4639 RepID=A0AAV8PIW1_ENSVE|nr:hypothetical protein OPV22_018341 [Ensete ventricosum]
MMNWVEVQKTLLHWLARRAGLQQQTVELESITIIYQGETTDPPECSPDFHADGLPRRATVHRHGVPLRRRGVVQTSGEVARPGQLPGRVGLHVRHDRFSQQYNSQAARRLILAEFLLPVSVKGVEALFSAATYRKLWFPNCFHRDFLEVMFTNRKERAGMLEALVISKPSALLSGRILLLWGENDKILNLELAKNIKEQLGESVTLRSIEKARHLVHLQRPFVYNRCLKEFLALIHAQINHK